MKAPWLRNQLPDAAGGTLFNFDKALIILKSTLRSSIIEMRSVLIDRKPSTESNAVRYFN